MTATCGIADADHTEWSRRNFDKIYVQYLNPNYVYDEKLANQAMDKQLAWYLAADQGQIKDSTLSRAWGSLLISILSRFTKSCLPDVFPRMDMVRESAKKKYHQLWPHVIIYDLSSLLRLLDDEELHQLRNEKKSKLHALNKEGLLPFETLQSKSARYEVIEQTIAAIPEPFRTVVQRIRTADNPSI